MTKFIVAVALFALVAVAFSSPQGTDEKNTNAKSEDLQTASSLHGGFYGGYPYLARGYSEFHRGYGGYGYGLGLGFPYGGYGYGFGY